MTEELTVKDIVPFARPRWDTKRHEVGIEIEIEGEYLPQSTGCWNVTYDGSLRGNASEYVIKRPVSRRAVPRVIARLDKTLATAGTNLLPSNRCGVHVHLNMLDKTCDQLLTFILLYALFEDLLAEYCGNSRSGNLFCLRIRDADQVVRTYMDIRKYGLRAMQVIEEDSIRYAALNLESLTKYGSLEFRMLQTPGKTLAPIAEWVEILLCIKDAAEKFASPEAVLAAISGHGGIQFMRWVFGRLARKLTVPNTEARLFRAARRIQVMAYAPVGEPLTERDVHVIWRERQGPDEIDDIWDDGEEDDEEEVAVPTEIAHVELPAGYRIWKNHLLAENRVIDQDDAVIAWHDIAEDFNG